MSKLPIGLQVFSIRKEAEADFVQTMRKVKSMGYDGVELAGLYGHAPEKIRDCLKEIGLNPISAHVPYDQLKSDLPGTVAAYACIGCKYIAIPYLTEEERYGTKAYSEMLDNIPEIAGECGKYDITLLYHNHDFEFQKTEEGMYVLDALYQAFPSEVLQTEIDTCWVKASGEDPAAYIRKYKNRCPVVHLKDFTGTKPVEFTALGQGVQDVQGLLTAAVESGAEWVIVEQDEHLLNSPMEDMKLSIEYLEDHHKGEE